MEFVLYDFVVATGRGRVRWNSDGDCTEQNRSGPPSRRRCVIFLLFKKYFWSRFCVMCHFWIMEFPFFQKKKKTETRWRVWRVNCIVGSTGRRWKKIWTSVKCFIIWPRNTSVNWTPWTTIVIRLNDPSRSVFTPFESFVVDFIVWIILTWNPFLFAALLCCDNKQTLSSRERTAFTARKTQRYSDCSAGPHGCRASSTATPFDSSPTARRLSSPKTSWGTLAPFEKGHTTAFRNNTRISDTIFFFFKKKKSPTDKRINI